MLLRLARLLGLATLLGCLGSGAPTGMEVSGREGRSVLFVGNSLTYFNDLPYIVESLVDSVPGLTPAQRISPAVAAFPDYALEDHWHDGAVQTSIATNKFEIVVLQQGSSALEESRVNLREYTRKLDARIRAVGGRTALYSVWPLLSRSFDFDRVTESYALAAADVNGMLFPVGEAWRAAWRRDPNIAFYLDDGLHPTVRGSYIGALVMAAMLTDRSPVGMPSKLSLRSGAVIAIPPAEAAVLQASAAEAIEKFGRR
jgi:hypothetical protein